MSSFQKFWAFFPRILDHHNHIKIKTQVVHIELLGFFFWADSDTALSIFPLAFPPAQTHVLCALWLCIGKKSSVFKGFGVSSNQFRMRNQRGVHDVLLPRRGEWAWGGREGMARERTSFWGSGFASGVVQAGQNFREKQPKIKSTTTIISERPDALENQGLLTVWYWFQIKKFHLKSRVLRTLVSHLPCATPSHKNLTCFAL